MAGVDSAIADGVAYIASQQQPDGSFLSHSSPTLVPFRSVKTYRTTFAPAIMLGALAGTPVAGAVRESLADWIVAQRSQDWSFNYWATDAPERSTLPYPDDLDDTFCSLIGLQLHDPAAIDASALAQCVRLLVATETVTGGPYRTWLATTEASEVWRDVDLAVNSNIAYFLSLVAEPLPNLDRLMEQALVSGKLRSPYYPSWHALAYYIARGYRGAQRDTLAQFILQYRKAGHWGTPLQTALALSALKRLGAATGTTGALDYLLASQQDDGSWPAESFCLDPAQQGRKHYNGAAVLTTALVVETLSLQGQRRTPQQRSISVVDTVGQKLHKEVWDVAKQNLSSLDPALKRSATSMLRRMRAGDRNNEVVLLPYFFATSLRESPSIRPQLLRDLGLANLFGWTAYTIYDDFLDDEGNPSLLPVANMAMRQSLAKFQQALPIHTDFQQLVWDTFEMIDGANAWEVAHCRLHITNSHIMIPKLPRYRGGKRLAERSLGHSLTPLGVLAATGTDLQSRPAQDITTAIQQYLVARQLSDDLHDWESDFRAGHCSYVVAAILRELSIGTGPQLISELTVRMRQQFWHHTLPEISRTILQHLALARQAIERSQLLISSNILEKLLDPIEASAQRTLDEQRQAVQFLAAYRA